MQLIPGCTQVPDMDRISTRMLRPLAALSEPLLRSSSRGGEPIRTVAGPVCFSTVAVTRLCRHPMLVSYWAGWSAIMMGMLSVACGQRSEERRSPSIIDASARPSAPTPSTRASASMAVWGRPFPPQTPEQETRAVARIWAGHLPGIWVQKPREKVCASFETSSARMEPANDAWGTPLDVQCDPQRNLYVMRSAGADRRFGTEDDIETIEGPGFHGGFAMPRPPLEPPRGRGPRPILNDRD
jgi:hypothetical protein